MEENKIDSDENIIRPEPIQMSGDQSPPQSNSQGT